MTARAGVRIRPELTIIAMTPGENAVRVVPYRIQMA
jgi:hypothetical protein